MPVVNQLRRAIEKGIAPGAILSYAAAGEDLVLDFLTGHAPSGSYVDVGCNHPLTGSNSYRFYRKGWRGIAIDANARFGPMFRRSRPRDRFIQACVSDTVKEVSFHHFRHDMLSSISGEHFYDNDDHYALDRVETMTTTPLTALLQAADCPRAFDFLSVDVEGNDEAVLRSLDFDQYRPRVILTELNGTDVSIGRLNESWSAIHLAKHDYVPIAVHWGNAFFRSTI